MTKKTVYVIQGRYSPRYGWEDLSAYSTRETAQADREMYREAEPQTPHRIVTRREES